jgi:[ribosomal protein S5]-alanine N-acetyltransferase
MATARIFGSLPVLETERLVLRKMQMYDLDDFYAYSSQPEVARYNSWEPPRSLTECREFFQARVIERYKRMQPTQWGVVDKATWRLVGVCGFTEWYPADAKAEIAYGISKTYWGRGYIPEAVRMVLAFGFRVLGFERIQAACALENLASERVMQKVGMTFEDILHEYSFIKERYEDLKLYSVRRQDYLPLIT